MTLAMPPSVDMVHLQFFKNPIACQQFKKDGNVTFKNVGINEWITLNWHHMEGCHFKPGRQQITMILKNLRINDTG